MEREPRIRFSVSYTTRKPRANEVEGRDYHFVDPGALRRDGRARRVPRARTGLRQLLRHRRAQRSKKRLRNGEQLLAGNRLAGRAPGARAPAGGAQHFHPAAVARALEQRLKARSTDSDAVIQRRLQDAAHDIAHWAEFDYVVINDRFDRRSRTCRPSSRTAASHLRAQPGRRWRVLAADLLAA